MSNYVFGTNLSYQDYLQAKSFERSLKSEISSSTKSIIASNEELQRENISVLRDLSSSVSTGFENISVELGDLSSGIHELNATFQWGFSELLTQSSRINDSLQELVRLAKTPAQTWAYEQFEIARDADRKGLFEEAIEYLDRAINGYGGQTGYKLEYRFHFLLGRIRLGSFRNSSREIVKPEEAERSFLYASRYAAQDSPREAARALLAAGWAAYTQGDMPAAQNHTQAALSFDPSLAEAHFQVAKVLMHIHDPNRALGPLQKAIELDRGYTIKAAADEDFRLHESAVLTLFDGLRGIAQKNAVEVLAKTNEAKVALEHERERKFNLVTLNLEKFGEIVRQAHAAIRNNTYYGYLDAVQLCADAQNELKKVAEQGRQEHQRRLKEIELEDRHKAQQVAAAEAAQLERLKKTARVAFGLSIGFIFCSILGPVPLIIGIIACRDYQKSPSKDGRGYAIGAIILGGIMTLVWIILLAVSAMNSTARTP